ncbi:MAG: prepilin peptidase, partial [Nitrospirales bacterium]|nr:prepilin peptidase [Nitrospirales bacterium]
MIFGIFSAVFGLIVGSFLNVCIYRIPRHISIITPSSRCPNCERPIRPWENIPVVSYLFLKGRCRGCGERISPVYPAVELLTGFLFWAVFLSFGLGWYTPLLFAFTAAMVVITFIDLEFQIIPDVISLPGALIGLASCLILPDPFSVFQPLGFLNSIVGLLLGGGLFYLIAIVSRGGMGGGDVKMMAMVGAFMGWKAILLTTFIGSLSGSLVGIALMIFKGGTRKTKIPFGPFLAMG